MKYAIRAALAAFCVTTAGAWAAGPASAPAVSAESIKMFPQPAAGQQRAVIALPALDNEADARVELMIGKTLPTDCNQQWFGGELTAEDVKGWGYTYYRLTDVKGPASTLMACPGQAPQQRFVPVRGDGQLLRYNSRLPLVVYVPEGFEVRYRVWHASKDVGQAGMQ
ncbi:serine protease inhibitor ecotin [Burkholderia vietnamiensis]|uniref:serine protease inhibitor ecotin n=1 Tax=Burkholderia vietnamiensis TaxID=60552 RepID=UPI001591E5F0|nr:serine protease inhibitor ecotin [Burkholderia vietnamiensis]MBR8193086.1 serine protease inhibitor ecotin [Burkholderia vietnamiensis]MCA8449513.1 serine protease inhibitor ecotin [Burkholderia vietnamiensis]MDN7666547.1 serine protease inhibitor ecotin [Burkholderia vietnamiensis]HDR8955040.1 serine protease inhibitor ecotin [Burkholderia vietnamiensis]